MKCGALRWFGDMLRVNEDDRSERMKAGLIERLSREDNQWNASIK